MCGSERMLVFESVERLEHDAVRRDAGAEQRLVVIDLLPIYVLRSPVALARVVTSSDLRLGFCRPPSTTPPLPSPAPAWKLVPMSREFADLDLEDERLDVDLAARLVEALDDVGQGQEVAARRHHHGAASHGASWVTRTWPSNEPLSPAGAPAPRPAPGPGRPGPGPGARR